MSFLVGPEDCTREEGLAHQETKDSKPLAIKSCRGCKGGRKLPVSHESTLERGGRAERASGIVPSQTPPLQRAPLPQLRGLTHPGEYLRPHPLTT